MGTMANSVIFRSARSIYSAVVTLAIPLVRFHLESRCRRGKENPLRVKEREGIASKPRPDGRVIWIHAASVGESISVLPLIEKLLAHDQDMNLLLTTGTLTSADLMKKRLPERVTHQFVPMDIHHWCERFLDHWKPSLVIWVESEFWPNILCAVKNRHIPLILLNGRISPQSYRRWQKCRWFIAGILANFDICLAQSDDDARYISNLGGENVIHLGNLKRAAPALPDDENALVSLQDRIQGRPRWLLSSSHPGEEEIVLSVHQELTRHFPDILTVIVPRHPERGDSIARASRAKGLHIRQRATGELPEQDTAIYVADTVGELGLFYRLCPIVLMGKSMLAPGGGQNPYEPATLGCTVILGPNMGNFMELSREMIDADVAFQVADQSHLLEYLVALLNSPALLETRAIAAKAFCARSETIIDNTATVIIEQLTKVD